MKFELAKKSLMFVYMITSEIFLNQLYHTNPYNDFNWIYKCGNECRETEMFLITSYPQSYYDACCVSYKFSQSCY